MKVAPAERDVAALRPYVKSVLAPSEFARWEAAAGLCGPNAKFRDDIGYALVRFLIASIGANHRVRPEDRKALLQKLKRDRAMTRALATALRRYGPEPPPDVGRALMRSIAREVATENAINQIGSISRGAPGYRAYENFVRTVAEHYGSASGKAVVVTYNNAPAVGERYSGPLAELLEAAFASAKGAWRESGLNSRLSAPNTRDACEDTMDNTPLAPRRMLRRPGAAAHVEEQWGYPLSPKTLAKLAVVGGGPRFRKAGRIPLYDPVDLDDWVRSKLSRAIASTSELGRVLK